MSKKEILTMRTGGFGTFPKGGDHAAEAYLSVPPPETEPDRVGAWVSGEPWNVTGYGIRFPFGDGITEQQMMDLEITYADSGEAVRTKMEFPKLSPDPDAANAFKAVTPLLSPRDSHRDTPSHQDLLEGFKASLGEVIRAYSPRHAAAIGSGGGEFVAGEKLTPALSVFASLLIKTAEMNGDEPALPEQDGKGAFFVSPSRAINLGTLFDRAAFRHVMMGETIPRALAIGVFECRHALDERLAGVRLPAQESWDAMMAGGADYFMSRDRAKIGEIGAEKIRARQPKPQAQRPDVAPLRDEDPASFGL